MRRRSLALLGWGLISACATLPPPAARHRPVLLVHGIDDSSKAWRAVEAELRHRGWGEVEAVDLVPNDASAGVPAMGEQVGRAVERLQARTGAAKVDVVAFSMGALVSRYWLLRQGGAPKVAHWVSISGPHHGTAMGWVRDNAGTRQMRWDSELLTDLARDEGDWQGVKAACAWTPFDLIILPATSSELKGARCERFPVVAHPLMLWDARVMDFVAASLEGEAPRQPTRWGAGWP